MRNRIVGVLPFLLFLFLSCTPLPLVKPTATSYPCPITPYQVSGPPDAHAAAFASHWFGNEHLWAGLAPPYNGIWYAGSRKVLWFRVTPGPLTVTRTRLDQAAAPLAANIPDGYGLQGIQASALIFPSEGCWEITANVADAQLRFTVSVRPKTEYVTE